MNKIITESQAKKMLSSALLKHWTKEAMARELMDILLCEKYVGPNTFIGLDKELYKYYGVNYTIVEDTTTSNILYGDNK